jgi:16S rRNA (uracil1498-N3)-methyltransferase
MHRFHLPPEQCQGPVLTLGDREAHHAIHVLRVAAGDRAGVLDGAGQELRCIIEAVHRDAVCLRVEERRQAPPPPFQITLLQAIPKSRMLEDIIEKATELGVHRIVPLLSERVVTRLDSAGLESRAAKWRQTAIEAIKQCGNPWLPRVEVPLTPQAFLARHEPHDLSLIASLQEGAVHPREHLRRFISTPSPLPRSVCVWVGPEGDFTPAEVALARSSGALPITLGQLVLRCETAAIYCLSLLHYELQAARP